MMCAIGAHARMIEDSGYWCGAGESALAHWGLGIAAVRYEEEVMVRDR